MSYVKLYVNLQYQKKSNTFQLKLKLYKNIITRHKMTSIDKIVRDENTWICKQCRYFVYKTNNA